MNDRVPCPQCGKTARAVVMAITEDGESIPCRAVCTSCRHDFDPRELPLFEPCASCPADSWQPCQADCMCVLCRPNDTPENDDCQCNASYLGPPHMPECPFYGVEDGG